MMEQQFLSVSEAARVLGMSADWVRLQEKSGRLEAIKSAGGIRLFLLEDVQKLAAKRQTSVGEAAFQWDLFICHASEDKENFVRPLAKALLQKNLKVWYDEITLTLGDSLQKSIDRGLKDSRFGVVVLSHDFFAKNWPQRELDGLVALERNGRKVILPIWHNLTRDEVCCYSPTLAGRYAALSSDGIDTVVTKILDAIQGNR